MKHGSNAYFSLCPIRHVGGWSALAVGIVGNQNVTKAPATMAGGRQHMQAAGGGRMITDSFVVVCGIVLAAGALLYGCVHVRPGSLVRWGVFVGCAVVATQFGWLPLLSHLGIRTTGVADQHGALIVMTVALKWLMETVLPWLVWSVDTEE